MSISGQDAHALHQGGRLQEAAAAYRLELAALSGSSSEVSHTRAAQIHMKLAFLQADLGCYGDAVAHIARAGATSPATFDPAPHVERIQYLARRSSDPATGVEIARMEAILEAIHRELSKDPLYLPSKFWEFHANYHVEMLKRYGIENFKRTLAHNYQNWLICSMQDEQLLSMLAKWPEHRSVQPLLNEVEPVPHIGFHHSMDFTQPEYPLAQRESREVYKLAVSLIWEYVLFHDGSGDLAKLEELEIGNPVRIRRQGRLISSDLAHSIRERNMVLDTCAAGHRDNLTIAELGAGHGRLLEVFGRTTESRYVIFDIAPALYVSQWYAQKVFPREKIFTFRPFSSFEEIAEELAAARFAFFTANQIQYFPDDFFDVFINMNSLMEMRSEQIANFLAHISRLTKSGFLSRQWLKWRNGMDDVEVGRGDFKLDQRWKLALDEVDEIHPAFFNQVWTKDS